jgi:hypothetical protein
MKKIINSKIILCFVFSIALQFFNNIAYGQSSFNTKEAKISIFSSTPLENIKAQSSQGYSVIIPKTQQIAFQLAINSLVFARPLMQEHFNENYMESDKYPNALFKGTIADAIDFTQDGEYTVTVKGILTLHGVAKERTIIGKIGIVNGKPKISSNFDILCVDHKIKIPSLVFKKIAQKININVVANYN